MIDRDLLPHLPIVRAVARHGGFTAAAVHLGLGVPAVSHAVRAVELRLGQPLFARTTRAVTPTEVGAAFLAAIDPALESLETAFDAVRGGAGRVTGVLRLNVPRIALSMGLEAAIVRAARLHRELVIEVTCDERLVDIVAEGFDAGVRVGGMIAEDMISIRLTPPFRTALVAAPAYLAERGEPQSIADLRRHDCIGYRRIATGGVYDWELLDEGRDVSVAVGGPVRVTDSLHARDLAEAGCGIAYLYEPLIAGAIADGRLRRVLETTAIEEPGLFLYCPRRVAETPKMRAFAAVLRRRLAEAARDETRGEAGDQR